MAYILVVVLIQVVKGYHIWDPWMVLLEEHIVMEFMVIEFPKMESYWDLQLTFETPRDGVFQVFYWYPNTVDSDNNSSWNGKADFALGGPIVSQTSEMAC